MTDSQTTFDSRCNILADLWIGYKDSDEFSDFVSYNDLGLPLAYCVANNIVQTNEQVIRFIDETFEVLLGVYGLEDTGFDSLDDIMVEASTNQDRKSDS